MTNLIIFGVVLLLLFLTRNLWANLIGSIVRKIKTRKAHNTIEHTGEAGAIFAPFGTTRTFVIAIDITEQGNGKAIITIAKLKKELTEKNE